MNRVAATTLSCPYCGESIEILVDCGLEAQSYIEDCQVCCRPMTLNVVIDEAGNPQVEVSCEDDA